MLLDSKYPLCYIPRCPATQPTNDVFTTYSGNCATVTDQAGKGRKSCSDALGRLIQVFEDPAGLNYETDYTYDTLDNPIQVQQKGGDANSANWRTRTFIYNSLSQLTSATNPEAGTTTYGYDADGNLAGKTDARGVTTSFNYDALHRLFQKDYSDGTASAGFVYDTSSVWGLTLQNPIGRLVYSYAGSAGTVSSYDSMGRTISQWQCTPYNCGTGSWNLNYAFNYLGGATTSTNGMGVTLTQSYDNAGRFAQLTSSWADSQHPGTLATVNATQGYYPHGAIQKMLLGNGLTQTAAYNTRLQPCRLNVNSTATALTTCADALPSGNLEDFNYGFSVGTANNGNISSWTATGTTGTQTFSRSYGYDGLNRLLTMSAPADPSGCTGLSWNYDPWGNRKDQNVTGGSCGTSHVTIGTNNRLLGSPYQYDAAGNLTADGSHTYTYDAENRLTKVDNGSTATYIYDGEGRRVRKTAGGTNTDYIYGLDGNVVADWVAGWNVGYVYLNSQLFGQYKNGTTYFVHKDHLGSTRVMTTVSGGVSDSMDFLPFGEQLSGDTGTSHKFTGKERDSESGLDNFGARYYPSTLGRWMSADLINLTRERLFNPANTINKYVYAGNNPLKYVDPNGQDITIFHRRGSMTNPFDSGHTFVAVLNQKTGKVAFLSFAPKAAHAPIGRAAYNANLSPEYIKQHASITIQTTPEAAQKAIDAIQKLEQDPAGTYNFFTNNCTTKCEEVLRLLEIATTDSIHPDDLWSWAYRNYSDDALDPNKRVPSNIPYKPGTEYGRPRYSGRGFDYQLFLFQLYLNQNSRPQRACVTTQGPKGRITTCD